MLPVGPELLLNALDLARDVILVQRAIGSVARYVVLYELRDIADGHVGQHRASELIEGILTVDSRKLAKLVELPAKGVDGDAPG